MAPKKHSTSPKGANPLPRKMTPSAHVGMQVVTEGAGPLTVPAPPPVLLGPLDPPDPQDLAHRQISEANLPAELPTPHSVDADCLDASLNVAGIPLPPAEETNYASSVPHTPPTPALSMPTKIPLGPLD